MGCSLIRGSEVTGREAKSAVNHKTLRRGPPFSGGDSHIYKHWATQSLKCLQLIPYTTRKKERKSVSDGRTADSLLHSRQFRFEIFVPLLCVVYTSWSSKNQPESGSRSCERCSHMWCGRQDAFNNFMQPLTDCMLQSVKETRSQSLDQTLLMSGHQNAAQLLVWHSTQTVTEVWIVCCGAILKRLSRLLSTTANSWDTISRNITRL